MNEPGEPATISPVPLPASSHSTRLLTIALWGVAGALLWFWLLHLRFEWQGALSFDTPIYRTVALGMREGLVPYRDLFETKPVGMFILMALSLALSDGYGLALTLHVVSLVLLTIIGVAWLWRERQTFAHPQALPIGIIALLCLAYFHVHHTSGLKSETFGALFALCTLWCLFPRGAHSPRWYPLLASVSWALTLATREPSAAALIAAGGLLCAHPRTLLVRLGFSVALGTTLLVVGLWWFGWLEPYVHILLPQLGGQHVQRIGHPLLRAFWLDRLFTEWWQHSATQTLFFIWLWLSALWQSRPTDAPGWHAWAWALTLLGGQWILLSFALNDGAYEAPTRSFALASLTIAAGIAVLSWKRRWTHGRRLSLAWLLLAVEAGWLLTAGTPILSWQPTYLWTPWIIFSLTLVTLTGLSLWSDTWRRHVWPLVTIVVAAYTTGLLTGLGGDYFSHHFTLPIPIFIAIVVLALRQHPDGPRPSHRWWRAITIILALLCLFPIRPSWSAYALELSKQADVMKSIQLAAATIDDVLDRCDIERYLYVGDMNGASPAVATRHVPLGPAFFQISYWLEGGSDHLYNGFEAALQETPIIVFERLNLGHLRTSTVEVLTRDMTLIPWPCAGDVPPLPKPFTLLYREPQPL
jgi:hypothetical protein